MASSRTKTTVLLGLTTVSLLLCATTITNALPAAISHEFHSGKDNSNANSIDSNSNSYRLSLPVTDQEERLSSSSSSSDPSLSKSALQRERNPIHDSILFGPQDFAITRPKEQPLQSPSSSLSHSDSSQGHDFQVSSFLESTRESRRQAAAAAAATGQYYHANTREQILHHCTTHFLALLDSEISDRLVAQLSRLIMMLPVIGVETRAVMRTKVLQVMEDIVASSGLTQYKTLRRVIQTAVDDAGLLEPSLPPGSAGKSKLRLRQKSEPRRQRFDEEELEERSTSAIDDDLEDDVESDDVDSSSGNSIEGDDTTEGDSESLWFRLPSALKRKTANFNNDDLMVVNESEIPAVAEVAMEAILDYMAEILTPTLVIHQLTEAIQSALQQIAKLKGFRGNSGDSGSMYNFDQLDINVLSSQNNARDHHSLDLLSDDWIWTSSVPGSSSQLEYDDGEADSDDRGQDEDLWDQDMELHPWDSTGRLFEDFEDDTISSSSGSNNNVNLDSNKDQKSSASTWDVAAAGVDDEEESDEDLNPFAIGIQDPADSMQADDEDDDDEYYKGRDYDGDQTSSSPSPFGNIARQTYLSRFQKRSLDTSSVNVATEVTQKDSGPSTEAMEDLEISLRKRSDNVILSRRRHLFAPDPRLENLLTQLIEPMLTSFIDEDFPASCKRVQGELMDGIIWSLDQTESSSIQESNDLDQLVLLAELEY